VRLPDRCTHLPTSAQDQHTPLMYAAAGGQLEIVQLLIGLGADVHAANKVSKTMFLAREFLTALGFRMVAPRFTLQRARKLWPS
jgi:hypothetical protein